MSALAVVREAAERGVRVSLNGDNVALKAAVKPSSELLAKLREHKRGIVALLRREARAETEKDETPLEWRSPDPLEAQIERRKRMTIDGVLGPYLDAWARLQVQRPAAVSDVEWRLAVIDAGLFLDRWGRLAFEFQWLPGDLFDVPRDGSPGGLVWFLKGEATAPLGPEHAVTESGRVFDRDTLRLAECRKLAHWPTSGRETSGRPISHHIAVPQTLP
jgi:hypothetical protein